MGWSSAGGAVGVVCAVSEAVRPDVSAKANVSVRGILVFIACLFWFFRDGKGGERSWLILAASDGDALDEMPLRRDEEGDNRQDDQRAGGHEVVPVGQRGFLLHRLERQGQRKVALIGQVDERTEKVVPGAQKSEQAHHDERRPAQG